MGLRRALVALLLGLAAWQAGAAGWIHAKAWLASGLIEDAWAEGRRTGAAVRPWPWADTWPVAELSAPRLAVRRVVLDGAHGEALAFGPGLAVLHGEGPGLRLVAGHRDTHLAFVSDLVEGDVLVFEDAGGPRRYRVVSTEVADAGTARIAPGDALVLVTCWPLDAAAPRGPLRYVVTARPELASLAAGLSR